MPLKGFPNLKAPPDAASFPSFWRMHRYDPSWPHKILCMPQREERKREHGDIVWLRLTLSWAWAAEIVT